MKKESESHLKNNKYSSSRKGYKKNIEKGEMKNEKYKKSLTTEIIFFTFIFCIWKRIYFAQKQSLINCSLYYYISSKAFLMLRDIWKQVMKYQRPQGSALVL